jgi:hypothetical protein
MTKRFVFLMLLTSCHDLENYGANKRRQREWTEPCHDDSVLLRTNGAPVSHECANRLHRMRVQVATGPSKEEAAALVFCECERSAEKVP